MEDSSDMGSGDSDIDKKEDDTAYEIFYNKADIENV